MDINNIHLIYQDFQGIKPHEHLDENICEECGKEMTCDEYFLMCKECGTIDFDKPLYVDTPYVAKPILYKRRMYCQEKLNLMTCNKQSRSPAYTSALSKLKNDDDFETIYELRERMSSLKLHKQYKHIYNLYYDVKKEKLIDLTHNEINKLSVKFVGLEQKFKQKSDEHGRQNMISYNTLIYFLMKQHNVPGYEHVILPLNHQALLDVLSTL